MKRSVLVNPGIPLLGSGGQEQSDGSLFEPSLHMSVVQTTGSGSSLLFPNSYPGGGKLSLVSSRISQIPSPSVSGGAELRSVELVLQSISTVSFQPSLSSSSSVTSQTPSLSVSNGAEFSSVELVLQSISEVSSQPSLSSSLSALSPIPSLSVSMCSFSSIGNASSPS